MVSLTITACAVLLTVATANFNGHTSCPYIGKVVSDGKNYLSIASGLAEAWGSDCNAWAGKHKDGGNFTFGQMHLRTQAELEEMCKRGHHQGALTFSYLYPAYTVSDMLFEIQRAKGGHAFAHVHFCRKTNEVTWSKVSWSNGDRTPELIREAGDRFLKQIYEHNDCGVYQDLVENNARVHINGNAWAMAKGMKHGCYANSDLAYTGCKENAVREKRVHIHNTIEVKRYYFDSAANELTMFAERHVEVIYRPGYWQSRPIAVALKFSSNNKIEGVRAYESELLHVAKKHAAYSVPDVAVEVEQQKEKEQDRSMNVKHPHVETPPTKATSAAIEKGMQKASLSRISEVAISAATHTAASSWPQMLFVAVAAVLVPL